MSGAARQNEIGLAGLAVATGVAVPAPYDSGVKWRTYADLPPAVKDADNPAVLIRGGWLERGGVSFVVSTAGTGKSIHDMQLCLCAFHGVPFSGLEFRSPLIAWDIRDEDSDRRLSVDRDDILAHLRENKPGFDWQAAAAAVRFSDFGHAKGADFINALAEELCTARNEGRLPDIIVINPLFAFFGGKITESNDCCGFFRGGEIWRQQSRGLASIAEEFNLGIIVYHHTPKPPLTQRDYSQWVSSEMPEYFAAGSGDIVNFGRSFITMLKVPGHPGRVALVAGKNGGGLGWTDHDGKRTTRHFMRHGSGLSVSGDGYSHYWQDPEEKELPELFATMKPSGRVSAFGPKPTPPPRDETPIVRRVFGSFGNVVAKGEAAEKVRWAVNAERRAATPAVKDLSRNEAVYLLEEMAAKGVIEILPKGSAGSKGCLCGLPDVVGKYRNQPLIDVPVDSSRATVPGSPGADNVAAFGRSRRMNRAVEV